MVVSIYGKQYCHLYNSKARRKLKLTRKILMPFIDINKLLTGERLPGWKGRSFNSETMTFAHYCFDAGSKIHEHCHSNEEVWTVIEGTLEVSVGAESPVAGARRSSSST